jgi:hypothetical protein
VMCKLITRMIAPITTDVKHKYIVRGRKCRK